MSENDRPILVTLVGALEALAGLIVIVCGILILLNVDVGYDVGNTKNAVVATLIIIGLVPFVVGYGMLRGWSVMWYIGVIIAALIVASSIYGIIKGAYAANAVPLVVQLVILYYLFRPKVKAFFDV